MTRSESKEVNLESGLCISHQLFAINSAPSGLDPEPSRRSRSEIDSYIGLPSFETGSSKS